MNSKEKLLKVLDFISAKDTSKKDLDDLSELLKAFALTGGSSAYENLRYHIISVGLNFISASYYGLGDLREYQEVLDNDPSHKPVIEYFSSLPKEYMTQINGQGYDATEIHKELATLREAVDIRRGKLPYEQQVEKINNMKAEYVEETPFNQVMKFIDTASEEDLLLMKKVFNVYCSQKQESGLLSSRVVNALFESPKIIKFIPHNAMYDFESAIKIHADVYKSDESAKAEKSILSYVQEPNPVLTYLSDLPMHYEGDTSDEDNGKEASDKRGEMRAIQGKIASRLTSFNR